MDEILTWYGEAADAADSSLAQLRSLPSLPEADQALVDRFHSAGEHEAHLIGKVAGAALFGDEEHVRRLAAKRILATQREGAVVAAMSARWQLDPEPLDDCPLALSG